MTLWEVDEGTLGEPLISAQSLNRHMAALLYFSYLQGQSQKIIREIHIVTMFLKLKRKTKNQLQFYNSEETTLHVKYFFYILAERYIV